MVKLHKPNSRYSGKRIDMTLPPEHLDMALSLIASLIGDEDRRYEMGDFQLTPDMIPEAMVFERRMLRLIQELPEAGISPTEWNIAARLEMDAEFKDTARSRIAAFLDRYLVLPAMPRLWAFNLSDWMERRNMLAAAVELQKIFAGNVGSSRDAFEEAMSVMQSVAPRLTGIEVKNAAQAMDEFEQFNREQHEAWKKGTALGPSTPWRVLNERTGWHREGDMWNWMAKSKHGKSTIAVAIAFDTFLKHAKDDVPYDVGYYHLETERVDLHKRFIASQIDLPVGDMPTLEIPKDKKTQAAYNRVKATIADASKTAELEYIFAPGIGFQELISTMADRKARATARGRKYVAIIDYYQEIDGSGMGKSETEIYNKMATELKNAFQSLRIYGHVFSQYNIDADYGSKKTSWNGSKLQMRSQVIIRVEREDAIDDCQCSDTNGKIVKDIMGNTMYFHKAGNVHSAAKFNVLMANGDSGGNPGIAKLRFVNAYFKIVTEIDNNGRIVLPTNSVRAGLS